MWHSDSKICQRFTCTVCWTPSHSLITNIQWPVLEPLYDRLPQTKDSANMSRGVCEKVDVNYLCNKPSFKEQQVKEHGENFRDSRQPPSRNISIFYSCTRAHCHVRTSPRCGLNFETHKWCFFFLFVFTFKYAVLRKA